MVWVGYISSGAQPLFGAGKLRGKKGGQEVGIRVGIRVGTGLYETVTRGGGTICGYKHNTQRRLSLVWLSEMPPN